MSFKKVSQLRKSGQLAQAYDMAINDLEQEKNNWTYSALFYVLNDLCKNALDTDDNDSAAKYLSDMDNILPNLDDAQGIAQKCISSLHNRLVPHIKEIREADKMSKDPTLVKNAYGTINDIYQNGELDGSLHTTFGWIIYRYAKQMLETGDIQAIKKALKTYISLSVERPSILHSCILRVAINLKQKHKTEFKFTNFFSLWGMGNLMEEDWVQGEKEDGTKFNSTVEQAICKFAAELKDDNITSVPKEFTDILNKAIERYHKPLYSHYKARILAASGHSDEALDLYRKLIAKMGQPYLWNDIAELLDDHKLRKAAICKYILAQNDKRYLGNTHLKLAEILIKEKQFAEALCELKTSSSIWKTNGFHVKPELGYLLQQIPANTVATTNNRMLYTRCSQSIDDFIFADCPSVFLVLSSVFTNKSKKLIAQFTSSSNNGRLTINAHQLRSDKKNGYHRFYTGRIIQCDGKKKIVGLNTASEQEVINGFPLKVIENTIKVIKKTPEKKYGFVENCYIHDKLLQDVSDGDTVKVYAQQNSDGKQQAVAIEKL